MHLNKMNDNLFNFKTSIVRKVHFNDAHRLENQAWNGMQNQKVCGKCINASFHGHNYELEVKLTGFLNSDTGFVLDAKELSNLINDEVIERLDQMNHNADLALLKSLIQVEKT